MTIYYNPASEKYPAKFNVNEKSITVADVIGVQEMIVNVTPDSVDMCIVMSSDTVGVTSKDKNFKPAGNKGILSFKKDKKQEYSVDEKKYVEVAVSTDENYWFTILSDYFAKNPAPGYSGQILPWINPFFWELINQNSSASSEMAGTMKDKLFALTPLNVLTSLTDDDKTKLISTSSFGSKGSFGAKQESEAEKLAARLAFFNQQVGTLVEFKSIGELAAMMPAIGADVAPAVKLATEITLKIIGSK